MTAVAKWAAALQTLRSLVKETKEDSIAFLNAYVGDLDGCKCLADDLTYINWSEVIKGAVRGNHLDICLYALSKTTSVHTANTMLVEHPTSNFYTGAIVTKGATTVQGSIQTAVATGKMYVYPGIAGTKWAWVATYHRTGWY
jgi:hypothetical protein